MCKGKIIIFVIYILLLYVSLRSSGALLCPFIVIGSMKSSIIWIQNLVYGWNWSGLMKLNIWIQKENKLSGEDKSNKQNSH